MTRAETTRQKLVDSAARLFAERGVFNVPLAEVVRGAGQRNTSAVLYHFGGATSSCSRSSYAMSSRSRRRSRRSYRRYDRRELARPRVGAVRPASCSAASDAGAHRDLMRHANYKTMVLADVVRDRRLFTLEEAVREMTDVPARLYGLRERGRAAHGWHAELVVFDPETVGSDPGVARHDLPAGAMRLYASARGVEQVPVGGRPVYEGGRLTGEAAGTVLRSGRDTETVTVPGG